MLKRVPILGLRLKKAKKVSRKFISLGDYFVNFFPGLEFQLQQADIDAEPREWLAIASYTSSCFFLLIFTSVFLIGVIAKIELLRVFYISFLVGISIGITMFFYLGNYPKLFVVRKVKDIEKNLVFAIQHLLIQVNSGVPLFNSLVSISTSNYGSLSQEIKKAVDEINTGKSEVEALEMLARENPSFYFRRILWQLINALKAGADIGSTLREIMNMFSIDQRIEIRKYGSQLNPLALFYMVFAVIFPTLGVTFLLVLTSFLGAQFNVEFVLIGVLFILFIFQFMFIGLVKSRRPIGV